MRSLTLTLLALLAVAAVPESALACERCFGAGTDAPAVRAVTASMLALFLVICFVFGGVFSFFNQAHARSQALDDAPGSSSSDRPS